ncbi:hypothetical protein BKA70DRAFT_1301754 [Coprinopsis sp. MPI-PUGE-AT-0042]|nr:hypothetical protein BKA70DRAFT_1301754 [Coprinopsis sp. MPI-PUGE-AT-0042]
MSRTSLGFWSHPHDRYSLALVDSTSSFSPVADDLAALVLLTIFSSIQGYLCVRIISHLLRRSRLSADPPTPSNKRFAIASLVLFVLHALGALTFVIKPGVSLSTAAKVVGEPPGGNSNQYTTTICLSSAAADEGCQRVQVTVPRIDFSLNVLLWSAMQVTISFANGLLVYRCFLVYRDKRRVWITALFVYALSLAVSVIGPLSSTIFVAQGDGSSSKASASSPGVVLSIALSIAVNIIVTVAITCRLLTVNMQPRGSTRDNGPLSKEAPSRAAAILLESALPSALFGLLICMVTIPFEALNIGYIHGLRVVWMSLLAMSPQVIALRMLQGRSWEQSSGGSIPPLALAQLPNRLQPNPAKETPLAIVACITT